MLEIATDKIAFVILLAREMDNKVALLDAAGEPDRDGRNATADVEDMPGGVARHELAEFLASLNEDEQAGLIALAWIGRGTYAPEELDEAIAVAKSEHRGDAVRYLMGVTLLSDYLEDASGQLGFAIGDEESSLAGPD